MACSADKITFLLVFGILAVSNAVHANKNDVSENSVGGEFDVKAFTVASEETEGYLRFIRSAIYYNVEVETLGMHEEWLGGSMASVGGGYKVNLLRKALEPYKDDDKKIVLFTDRTNVDVIVHKFKKMDARILFGAEKYIWPDDTLEHLYPVVSKHLPKYLNSGLFVGYASDVYEILKTPIKDKDDDQLYYTRVFLDSNLRSKLKIKLDYESEIFQNLHGVTSDVRITYNEASGEYFVKNILTDTVPSLIHGNGNSKVLLNNFGSYVAGAFKHQECQLCLENKLELPKEKDNWPKVTIAIAVAKPTPFLEEFFDSIYALEYPKEKLSIFIYNNVQYHDDLIQAFLETHGSSYVNVKQIRHVDSYTEPMARNLAVSFAEREGSGFLFVVDAEAHVDNPHTLIRLIEQNRNVIAPVMTRFESYKIQIVQNEVR